MSGLGFLSGLTGAESVANAVNGDGSVVVGWSQSSNGAGLPWSCLGLKSQKTISAARMESTSRTSVAVMKIAKRSITLLFTD
jgi:uncharacterized membrane protein